jgi:hypothetical protein
MSFAAHLLQFCRDFDAQLLRVCCTFAVVVLPLKSIACTYLFVTCLQVVHIFRVARLGFASFILEYHTSLIHRCPTSSMRVEDGPTVIPHGMCRSMQELS